ncbi:hypothetical protein AXX17_ATUG04120 [Arabidopsis thaliana]|uniref:Uncharacterized protein n=1 Tax=Arabidopsis thaliana TaxID=3702 RepID=A0A178U797_ARATH|nr:hypothetical protein AXX17_ATUG04120 [Arabidopsis thaliana]
MNKIMIVEDDAKIAELLKSHIQKYGDEAIVVDNFGRVFESFQEQLPQVVLLDVNLPSYDGYYWCRQIRTVSTCPIIFISARSGEMDQVMALESGADDYITKPFHYEIVMAKIRSQIRRVYGDYATKERILEREGLSLYPERMELRLKEHSILLTRKESLLMETLMHHYPRIASRETILDKLWDDYSYVDDNALSVNVTRLRKKLADLGIDEAIETLRGMLAILFICWLDGYDHMLTGLYALFLGICLLLSYLTYRYVRLRPFYQYLTSPSDVPPQDLKSSSAPLATALTGFVDAQHRRHRERERVWEEQRRQHLTFMNQWVHQMKTPLSVIELITQDGDDERLASIAEESDRLRHGVDMVLYMARRDTFAQDFHIDRVPLRELVNEVIRDNRRSFIRHYVYPEIVIDASLTAETDAKWLRFIIQQLISNAITYSAGSKTKVTFSAYAQNKAVILSIEDRGVGIPESDLKRVFDPFFTGENGRTFKESTGMGLYLVKEVAELLHHQVEMESELSNLCKTYNAKMPFEALSDINLTIEKGEFVGIMGPSGSGKTTLLNLVSTIDEPTSGEVLVDGTDPHRMNPDELALFRRRRLGFIFQSFNLLSTLTVKENILLPLTLEGVSLDQMNRLLEPIAVQLGLTSILDKRTYEISGGQAQRTAIARALIHSPKLVLADEPTGNLDSKSARDVMELLTKMNKQQASTMMLVTHDAMAASYCDRVVFIKDGKFHNEITQGGNREFAFNNVIRNKRVYLAHFLSCSFSVLVFFIYALLLFHPDLQGQLTSTSRTISELATNGMRISQYAIFIFSFFFCLYSGSVFLQTRKREFGILMMHGMSPRQLRRLVFTENTLIGGASIITGIIAGLIFTKVILLVIAKLLVIQAGLTFYVPMQAIGLTVAAFVLMFGAVALVTSRIVRSGRLADLFQAQEKPKPEPKPSPLLSILAVLLILAGYGTVMYYVSNRNYSLALLLTGVVLVTTGTYFLFAQLSVYVIRGLKRKERVFFRRTNLLTLSQLAYRMKDNATMFFMIAIISAIAFTGIGTVLAMDHPGLEEMENPYAYMYKNSLSMEREQQDISLIKKKLDEHGFAYQSQTVHGKRLWNRYTLVKQSEYDAVARMQGKQQSGELADGESLIHPGSLYEANQIAAKKESLPDSLLLQPNETWEKFVSVKRYVSAVVLPDQAYTVVVNDHTFDAVPQEEDSLIHFTLFNVPQWKDTRDISGELAAEIGKGPMGRYEFTSLVLNWLNMKQTNGLLFIISAMVGVVFFTFAASLLYFRLYADMERDREQYRRITQLGLLRRELRSIVTKQLLLMFFLPIGLALLHSGVAFLALQQLVDFSVWTNSLFIFLSFIGYRIGSGVELDEGIRGMTYFDRARKLSKGFLLISAGERFLLKARIELLCKKKQISRKDLVEGLITQAHFANILAGRYPFADDLAEHMAVRLGIPVTYLTAAAATDEETLQRAEHIFQKMSGQAVSGSYVETLEDRDDTLVVELTTSLMKAVYYQQMNDQIAYDYLHQSYLNHYLEKYGRPDEVDLPAPLKKALLLYKIQHYRSKGRYYDVMNDVNRLSSLVEPGTEIWLTAQSIRMEACVLLKEFEQAKQVFEQTMRQIVDDRLYHRLSGLYVAYSGYCFAMGLVQEALRALSMAEANLVYLEQPGDVVTTIMNNRIVMLTMTGEPDKALEEIIRFEAMIAKEPGETQRALEPVTTIYRCEAAYASKNWGLLAQGIERLRLICGSIDQEMALVFYESQLALAQGDAERVQSLALECLPYFESTQHVQRLEQLYEALAVISEEGRRYKESSLYYRKLVYLLRENGGRGPSRPI